MTAAYREHAENRASWDAAMPNIVAKWGLVSALAEIEALATSGSDALPAPAGRLREPLRAFVAHYGALLDSAGEARAARPDPFVDPTV